MLDTNQVLDQALGLHRAGRFSEAEGLYRQILAADPEHTDSLHLLGVIAFEGGKHEAAVELIGRAIARNNGVADYHCNIALALASLGRWREAEGHFLRAIDLNPNHPECLNNFGNALKERGRLADAEAHLRQAVAARPNYAQAHFNLGNVLLALGRHDEAVQHYRLAVALRPAMAGAHYNLGQALKDQGKLVEAAEAYRRAQAIDPGWADAHNNLGTVLYDLGRMAEAEACFRQALAQRSDDPLTLSNLANALAAQGKLDDAVAYYRRSLALAPDVANVHNTLGNALERQGKHDEAAAAYRRAIELDPHHAGAPYNLGNVLAAKADPAVAIAHYKQLLAAQPNFADGWNNMGFALAERGDLDAAREACQKAVAIDRTRAVYHRSLAILKRFEPGDPQLAVMEELAANSAAVPEKDLIDLHFALGKAYADLKEHDRSFRHLLAGNRLKREQLTYDDALSFVAMLRVRNVFSAELLRSKAGGGERTAAPVFIVGMPRSGTTLIEQIIASHPKAFGAGERLELHSIVHGLNGSGLRFPEVIETMSREQLREIGTRYVAAIRALAPQAERVVDKMPWNFNLLGLIHLALPNARIIHARRDPVDTCFSCFSILFVGDGHPYTYDLGELGRYYRSYESLMAHWRTVLPPGIMIEVQYEEVVADLENEARRIIAHCGLAWDDACLAFHKTRRPVRTASISQVRQPIYKSSVGRWRPYREHLRPLLKELGIDAEVPVSNAVAESVAAG